MKRVQKDDTKLFYSNPKSREVLKQKVRQVFNLFDTDGSGEIDAKEFHDLIYSMGKIMTDEEVAQYLKVLDRDGNGSISFDEFFDWWCTRDDTHSKGHSVDKLKEVKAKLQSRSWMRSISYLINKAKNDLEAEKAKAQNNNNTNGNSTAEKSVEAVDPKGFVIDTKVKIGQMKSEDAKTAIKLSYARMSTPAKIYRLEFQLVDGATDEDAEKVKQAFIKWNNMMAGMIFQDISIKTTMHGNVRHAIVEMSIANAGPAEAALKNANLSKLQFSLESSQRLEELNLKTIQLNFGLHLEASRLIMGMLPPPGGIGPLYHAFMTMTRRMAFELEFNHLHEAVIGNFSGERFFSQLNTNKRDMALTFRTSLIYAGIEPNLPIAELKQVLVQIDHNSFVLDIKGVDISFFFKDGIVEPNLQVPPPQPAPIEVPVTVTKEPEVVPKQPEVVTKEPEVVVPQPELPPHWKVLGIESPSEALVTWLSQFSGFEDELPDMPEDTKQLMSAVFEEYNNFSADRIDPTTGKVFPIILEFYIPRDRPGQMDMQHEINMFNKMKGFPYVYEYMDMFVDGQRIYAASTHFAKLGYIPLFQYVVEQRNQKPNWADYEPIALNLAQKALNALMIFNKTHVTHGIAETLLIHPETLDCRINSMAFFREHPVAAVPEGIPAYNMPPELFTVEGVQNYGTEVDVWSYGNLCYIIFTGNFPYDIELGDAIMDHIVVGDWNRTAPFFTELPEKARNFLTHILVTDKNARPTLTEISRQLEFLRN